jgi:glyoxylate reductase
MSTSPALPLVLVTHTLPSDWLISLAGRCETVVGPENATRLAPELAERLGDAEGLFALLTIRVDVTLLARAPRLRVVSNMAVGYDNIDVAACTRRGIPVGNTPGVLTDATADLTMALLLAIGRGLPQAAADAREGRWTTWAPAGWLGADLHAATLGIVGLGKIGRAVAQRAQGFGMRLVYHEPVRLPDAEAALGVVWLPVEELLRVSDFVTLHVPLIPQTRGLINESALRSMKRTAYLVNTARGPVVDMAALTRA